MEELITSDGHWCIALEAQAPQRLGHLAIGPDSSDGFLTDIAALGVADTVAVESSLWREVALVDVHPEARNPGLDAGQVQSGPPHRPASHGSHGQTELVPDHAHGRGRDEHINPLTAGAGMAHPVKIAQFSIRPVDNTVTLRCQCQSGI